MVEDLDGCDGRHNFSMQVETSESDLCPMFFLIILSESTTANILTEISNVNIYILSGYKTWDTKLQRQNCLFQYIKIICSVVSNNLSFSIDSVNIGTVSKLSDPPFLSISSALYTLAMWKTNINITNVDTAQTEHSCQPQCFPLFVMGRLLEGQKFLPLWYLNYQPCNTIR